jgi:hypothetical protein
MVKSVEIIRPEYCTKCGTGERTIHGHYEDYSKPKEVQHLCTKCHAERHGWGRAFDTKYYRHQAQKAVNTRRRNGTYETGAQKRLETIGYDGLVRIGRKIVETRRRNDTYTTGAQKTVKTIGHEGYVRIGRKGAASQTPEKRSETAQKGVSSQTHEKLCETAQKAIETQRKNGTLIERVHKGIASQTHEKLCETVQKMVATLGPGGLKRRAQKAIETQRKNGTLAKRAQKGVASQTSEQRSEKARKGIRTRRIKLAKIAEIYNLLVNLKLRKENLCNVLR